MACQVVEARPHDRWQGGRGGRWGRGEGRIARIGYLRVGKGESKWAEDLSISERNRRGPLGDRAAEDGE